MAETQLPDLFLSPEEFRSLHNELLVVRKQNRIATTTPADARRKAIAQWANLADGLFLRLHEQVSGGARSVRVYGAIGDGVTDDTDAIQAAIDGVEDDGGGVVFFPLGTYLHEGFTPAEGVRLVYLAGDDPNTLELLGADGDIAVAVIGETPLYVKTGGTGTTGWEPIGGGDVALADLPDATALSLLGRAANSAGDYADIVAGTNGHVMRRNADALAFGTLVAGSFATGPGIVTPAMLDNGAACSVIGRAANSSGARADIPAIDDETFVGRRDGVVGFYSVQLAELDDVLAEIDFTAEPAGSIADGAVTVGGLPFTSAQAASAATWRFSGTGLDWALAAATAGVVNSTTQTAAHLYTTLGDLPGWRSGREIIVDLYIPSFLAETSGDGINVGLWRPAGTPYSGSTVAFTGGGFRREVANAKAPYHRQGNAAANAGTANYAGSITDTVVSLWFTRNGAIIVGHGTWSSGWPTDFLYGQIGSTTFLGDSPLLVPTTRLVISAQHISDASPTSAWSAARMRIRRAT